MKPVQHGSAAVLDVAAAGKTLNVAQAIFNSLLDDSERHRHPELISQDWPNQNRPDPFGVRPRFLPYR
jgi:hypothetical protein